MTDENENSIEWNKRIEQNETTTKKGKKIDINVEIDNRAFTELSNENAKLKLKIEELENAQQESNKPADVVGHGAGGSVPLSHNTESNEQDSWDSVESMMFDLSNKKALGDKKATEQYNAILEKFARGIKSGLPNGVIYSEEGLPNDEPSLIMKVIQNQNRRLREKMLRRRDEQ